MCLAKGHNAVTPVRLEPTSLGLESSTQPLRLETAQTVEMCQYSANTSYLQEIILSNITLTFFKLFVLASIGGIREEKMYISII